MNAGPFSLLRRHSRLRLAATLLCLLACTLQSFVAQTHVHVLRSKADAATTYDLHQLAAVAVVPDLFDADDRSSKHGSRDGSSTCPLCQIVLHGGAAPAPVFALSLPMPVATAGPRYEQAPSGALVAVSFNWQGRAPPLT
jgi:hypothetical protein